MMTFFNKLINKFLLDAKHRISGTTADLQSLTLQTKKPLQTLWSSLMIPYEPVEN